jgi:hypothetical protein
MSTTPRNSRTNAVTKFCLVMEEHRRTAAGRVRTAKEMLDHFFPRPTTGPVDRVFHYMPPAVRGPIVSGWGIRGSKSALRDTDDKVKLVVGDALASGDIDENAFEEGVNPAVLIDWMPLAEWWAFWRGGKLTGVAIQKALAAGRDLDLFDEKWFLENIQGRGGKLKGTDTLCDTLSKDQIVTWVKTVHQSGDGSPSGLVHALGWDVILAKTAQDALLYALDELARHVGLVAPPQTSPDVAMPDIPDDLEPPSIDSMASTVGATADALSEARAAMMTSLQEEAGSKSGA